MNAPIRTFEESRRISACPSYCVTESGRVGRIGHSGWLRSFPSKRGGYPTVSLWENNRGRPWPVHQLVAIAFNGPRPTPRHDCAHNDGDKRNNHWSNLRWATRAENESDKIAHGTSNRGERNGRSKITDAQADKIAADCACGHTQKAVALRYGITQSGVSRIINRTTKVRT